MKKRYEITKMYFEIDKLKHCVNVGGYVDGETKIEYKNGKLTKTITVNKVEFSDAWFDDGSEIDLDDSYLDKEAFIEKAEHYLAQEFLT